MTDEEMIANRAKRPLYHVGQRLQICNATHPPSLNEWQGVVRSVKALQHISGYVRTYLYRLEMDNLAMMEMDEDTLKPVEEEAGSHDTRAALVVIAQAVTARFHERGQCPLCDGTLAHTADCPITQYRVAMEGSGHDR